MRPSARPGACAGRHLAHKPPRRRTERRTRKAHRHLAGHAARRLHPPRPGRPGVPAHHRAHPNRRRRVQRHGIRLGLETGQETAASLLDALAAIDRDSVGVNFDPANMILYAMGDPVEALDRLAPHVVQIHVKDAIATDTPGRWGTEVPAGTGQVDWPAFFAVVRDHLPGIPLVIEREAGDRRIEDIRSAASLVQQHAEVIRG
ncbi:MAG: sugar phosphate isomerase/epimerase family protein [Phycisphaerales bacterium]